MSEDEAGAGEQLGSFIECPLVADFREAPLLGTQTPYPPTPQQSDENLWLGFPQLETWCLNRFLCGFHSGVPSPCSPAYSSAPNHVQL